MLFHPIQSPLLTACGDDVSASEVIPHPLIRLYGDAENLVCTPNVIPTKLYARRQPARPLSSMLADQNFCSLPSIRASPRDRFEVLKNVAGAIKESHSKDIVHGNLTPVWWGENRRNPVKEPISLRAEEKTPNAVLNARWAAPELFTLPDKDEDYPRPTKMSDVYSFGCLMLQVLTGKIPYCGTKRSEQVVYLKYLGREPIDAQTPEVAGHYLAFMRKCWSPVPENRPTIETVVDFVHEEMEKLAE
ncbi:hypothetical protein BDN67DRAFT_967702 [Paxillus ammoniavirescens]|nr:hypothetical protein BDN67DRAFT_967702 [Paxillus ammoniavirescens]